MNGALPLPPRTAPRETGASVIIPPSRLRSRVIQWVFLVHFSPTCEEEVRIYAREAVTSPVAHLSVCVKNLSNTGDDLSISVVMLTLVKTGRVVLLTPLTHAGWWPPSLTGVQGSA